MPVEPITNAEQSLGSTSLADWQLGLDISIKIFQFIYFIIIPLLLLTMGVLLLAYCVNMIRGVEGEIIPKEIKFRRSVASVFPFILSVFSLIVVSEESLNAVKDIHWAYFFFAGFLIGYLFIKWIGSVDKSGELASTLSCFVASLIFFSLVTALLMTKSLQAIGASFGFVAGASVYVIAYGVSNVGRFRIKRPKPIKYLKEKMNKHSTKKREKRKGKEAETAKAEADKK